MAHALQLWLRNAIEFKHSLRQVQDIFMGNSLNGYKIQSFISATT